MVNFAPFVEIRKAQTLPKLIKQMDDFILPTSEELALIEQYIDADVRDLALKLKELPFVRNDYVLQQIAGRQLIKTKVPSWATVKGMIYPIHLSIEQSSSELTARYKASLVGGEILADLTGGLGVDFAFMSQKFDFASYIEQKTELVAMARNNMQRLGLHNVKVSEGDAMLYLNAMTGKVSCIYVDPSRRSNGRRVIRLESCTPDISIMAPKMLQRADIVMIKLSPMLDISEALTHLSNVETVHVVSVDNECKELLFVLRAGAGSTEIVTVNLSVGATECFAFKPSEERNASCRYAYAPMKYLYEPNASIMKAGAFKCIASHYQLEKLHFNSHLYTSENLVADFPGRRFEIVAWSGLATEELSTLLEGVRKANIAVRNFPMRPTQLRDKLKLKDGGDDYLFATTLIDGKKVVIRCRKA